MTRVFKRKSKKENIMKNIFSLKLEIKITLLFS